LTAEPPEILSKLPARGSHLSTPKQDGKVGFTGNGLKDRNKIESEEEKMKKAFGLVALLMVCLGMVGCPGPSATPPYDEQETANVVYGGLKDQGFTCEVYIGDFDEPKNNALDYGIVSPAIGNEDKLFELVVYTSIIVGNVNSQISWRSDKVFLQIGETLFVGSAAGMQQFVACANRNCSDDELRNSFMAAWGASDNNKATEVPSDIPL
jgi:hypothetical protein